MHYPEESHALELYQDLFATCRPGTEIAVNGSGVHWRCTATRGRRVCSVACLDLQGEVRGPEYVVSFEHDAREDAIGRTSSKSDTIAAIVCWLDGYGIAELHKRFAFVDQNKRALAAIENEMVQRCPELEQAATRDVHQIVGDLYELWFRAGDRSCRISFYGKNPLPDCLFHWDERVLFHFPADSLSRLSMVLKRWLCEDAMPSQMRAEFPGIPIGPLADYYEAGRAVEGEFITSWDAVECFYRDERIPFAAQALHFISEIRRAGYDRTLRAGQSMWSLVLSRSRRHGLRADQPRITFSFRDGEMDVFANVDDRNKLTLPDIKLTPQLAALLQQLAARDID